ncbi:MULTISPECIES: hypothetical protein [Vibrio]|uniref:hypothetical protein n=1 Tax=Vibrio TaxID=662 RepID=UPI000472AB24|nr:MULTISPECIES: hypothetical protein [Vibrio]EJU9538335.1 hypothetical protein [Vibrio alginolyticus]MBS9834328.1 hypothetical protein [Vibrio alginolyticus]MDA0100345.1 hypothetical protein [Vibrio sp. ART SEL2]ULF68489.1 hypothetical protein K6745_13235 [Vibrio alginolyticus]
MQELTLEEMDQVCGGSTNYGAEFVGGCVAGVVGAAAATGGMSLPLAAQTCLAGGSISVIGAAAKNVWLHLAS